LSAANQTKKAQVPPRRSAAQGAFGALSGWPVYYGLPQGAATPEGYRAYSLDLGNPGLGRGPSPLVQRSGALLLDAQIPQK
ncbi:MAG TPA: hypothetical protein VKP61_11500, partial [Candidatus Acidoferrum sp.]|nr:hypothetical protein [Candidatus Acidoferrum sp.]